MSPLKLLRIWLLALVVALVGCGGHDDVGDLGLDASGDVRKSDAASDRASDTTGDNRDAGSDVRADVPTTPDVRIDTPVVDVRIDTPVVDTRVDVRVDAPVVDVRVDTPVADVRIDTPVGDVRVDTPDVRVDAVADVRPDLSSDVSNDVPPSIDVTSDPSVDGGCTSDNQCGQTAPHCNTTTGACVARVAIAVTPANTSIAVGTTQQFTATMTYSDTSTGDVTALASWLSSLTTVATLNPGTPGLATGVAQGTTTISATFAGLAAGTQLGVTMATLSSIQVAPANASSPVGTTRQFTATGKYSDQSTQDLTTSVTWASSGTSFATIDAAGLATAVAVGPPIQISATLGAISDAVTFTVTSPTLIRIDVSPPNATIATLTTQDYLATGVYTDNSIVDLTTQATWASSDLTVATLNGTTATGISQGTSNISAAFNGVTGTTPLHVTGATLTSIDVTPANPTAPAGFNVQFKATGHFNDNTTQDLTADVLWSSSDDAKASISNAGGSEGLATALAQGTSTIGASIVGVQGSTLLTISTSPLASIEVTPSTPSIALGTKQAFTAIAHFMDATTLDVTGQVSWSSSALGVATVSNTAGTKGVATSVTAGTATITASFQGANGSATLTVTPATIMTIVVSPPSGTVTVGTTTNFTAMGTYSNSTMQDVTALVTWSSSDTNIATISNGAGSQGQASGVTTGDVTVRALLNGVNGTAMLHVNP